MWCITLINLHMLNHTHIPGIILLGYAEWILNVLLFQFASIFLRIFASIFIRDMVLWWCLCLALVSGWCQPDRMSSEVFLLLLFWGGGGGDNLRKIDIDSSLNVWQNSPMKSSSPALFCVVRFVFITLLISLFIFYLFRLSISSWFCLDRLYVSRNFSTSSGLSNFWHIIVHISS